MKNADMPAMPQYAWNDAAEKFTATGGLTKREAFAMAAMQGLLSDLVGVDGDCPEGLRPIDHAVNLSVIAADLLLAALGVSNE